MSIRRRLFAATFVFALIARAQTGAFACPSGVEELAQPMISTIAGVGSADVRDGRADQAAFIEPDGTAVGPDGTIYVADGGAQNIRAIKNGIVTTVAGNAAPGPSPQQRIGGYRDGPAHSALFHRPLGVAVGADGSLYVADSLNHVIRKISHGMVTTFAGSPSKSGGTDGKGTSALFVSPRAIAIDAAGNLYVADRGAGIRKIAPDQTVTTLQYGNNNATCGVSANGSGTNLILSFTDNEAIYLVEGAYVRRVGFDQDAEPPFEKHRIGFACNTAILDREAVVASDPATNSVRFIRFPIGSMVGAMTMLRTLVTGRHEGFLSQGGYRNGGSGEALVDIPRGIAVAADGTLIIADAGNRRIRSISHVNPRGLVDVDKDGQLRPPSFPSGAYRIVMMSNSYGFLNAMWADSIPGQIEGGLLRDRSNIGLSSCASVIPYRLSGGGIRQLTDIASIFYGEGTADLIVFLIDGANITHEISGLIAAKKLPPDVTFQSDMKLWRQPVVDEMRDFSSSMAKKGTKVLYVVVPDSRSISPLEQVNDEGWPESLQDYYATVRPAFMPYLRAQEFVKTIESSGLPTLDLFHPMEQAESRANRKPFFNPIDNHISPDGSIWVGTMILRDLERRRPWNSAMH